MAEQSFIVPRQGPAPAAAPCEGHGRVHGPRAPSLGLAGGVGVAGALGALSLRRRRARARLARRARQVRVEVPEMQDVEKGLGLTGLDPEKLMAQAGHVGKDLEKAVSRWAKPEVLQRDVTHAAEQAVKEATAMLPKMPSELKLAIKDLTAKVEAILPADLAKLSVHLPPEISALLAHPEVLDPVKIPAGAAGDQQPSFTSGAGRSRCRSSSFARPATGPTALAGRAASELCGWAVLASAPVPRTLHGSAPTGSAGPSSCSRGVAVTPDERIWHGRFLEAGLKVGGYTFQMKLDEFLNRSDEMRPQRAIEARELITDLGVTFIKIAQVWASRPASRKLLDSCL